MLLLGSRPKIFLANFFCSSPIYTTLFWYFLQAFPFPLPQVDHLSSPSITPLKLIRQREIQVFLVFTSFQSVVGFDI